MRSLSVLSAVWLAGLANAADIVYVTDLEIYTLLVRVHSVPARVHAL